MLIGERSQSTLTPPPGKSIAAGAAASRRHRSIAIKQGDKLLAVTTDAGIAIWNLQTPDQPPKSVTLPVPATSIHMSSLSPWIAVGLVSGAVHLIDATSGAAADYVIPAPRLAHASSLAASQSGRERKSTTGSNGDVAADQGSVSNSVQSLNATSEADANTASGSPVRTVAFSPVDPNLLLIAYDVGAIVVWDLAQRNYRKRFAYSPSAPSSSSVKDAIACLAACWKPDGEQIVASFTDGQIAFWLLKDEWMASVLKKDENRKPIEIRTFLSGKNGGDSSGKEKESASEHVHPIVHLAWESCVDPSKSSSSSKSSIDTHSVLVAAGGLPASGSNGIACLVFGPKSDISKRKSITEVFVTTPVPPRQVSFFKPFDTSLSSSSRDASSQQPPISIIALMDDASVAAYAVDASSLRQLDLPPSLRFDAPSFDTGENSFVCIDCPDIVMRDLRDFARNRGPPRLPVSGGQITHSNTKSISEFLCVIRPQKQLEFWNCSVPIPVLFFVEPMHEWLPPSPISGIHVRMDEGTLAVRLGSCVVVHELVTSSDNRAKLMSARHREVSTDISGHKNDGDNHGDDGEDKPDEEDLDEMMAKLDATMNDVLENSDAITQLIAEPLPEKSGGGDPVKVKDPEKSTKEAKPRKASKFDGSSIRAVFSLPSGKNNSTKQNKGSLAKDENGTSIPAKDVAIPSIPAKTEPLQSDAAKDNKNIWIKFLDASETKSAVCWEPVFEATHAHDVTLVEYSRDLHIIATATPGHVHVADTLTGREILTDDLSTPSDANPSQLLPQQQNAPTVVSAVIMCILPMIVGEDPSPQPSLVVATDAGTLLVYPILLNPSNREMYLNRQTMFNISQNMPAPMLLSTLPSSTQNHARGGHHQDKPVYLAAIDQAGKLMRRDRLYSSKLLSEQYTVVVTHSYAYVLFKEGAKPVELMVNKDLVCGSDHIVVSRVSYILGGATYLVSVTSQGRLLVLELPAMTWIANMVLPDRVDTKMLHQAFLSQDGRLGYWATDGCWEMISFVKDMSGFPTYESRMYDLYRARQWCQARDIRMTTNNRNAEHDALFNPKQRATRPTADGDSEVAAEASASGNAIAQTNQKLNERGEKLEQLEVKFSDLADSSKEFVKMVRSYNDQQSKKKWYEI